MSYADLYEEEFLEVIRPGDVLEVHWRAKALLNKEVNDEGEPLRGKNAQVSPEDWSYGTVCSLCGKVLYNLDKTRWVETIDGIVQPNYGVVNQSNDDSLTVFWPVGGKCLKKINRNSSLLRFSDMTKF